MSDNEAKNGVVDATIQLIYEYELDDGKREELVQSVIRMASDPNVSDKMKIMCLWMIENDIEMFRFMQEKFQVPSSALDITDEENMDEVNNMDGGNLLYRACEKGWPDMVEELIQNQGMSVNMQCSWGFTPLMMAASGDDEIQVASTDAARVLLNHPAIDIELRDTQAGQTALLWAAKDSENSIEMVKLLLKNGANSAAKDIYGHDILTMLMRDYEPYFNYTNFKNLVTFLVKDVGVPVPETMPYWARTNGFRSPSDQFGPEIMAVCREGRMEPRTLAILARRAVWRVHKVEQLTDEDVPENLRLFLNLNE